jgi:hypothetical protein
MIWFGNCRTSFHCDNILLNDMLTILLGVAILAQVSEQKLYGDIKEVDCLLDGGSVLRWS